MSSEFSPDAGETRIDFGLRSHDYATERPGFPDSFYDRVETFRPLKGARALDLGTGPGTVAIKLAERGAFVVGTDIAENQIAAAREVAKARGLTPTCQFEVMPAEQTTFGDASFDLVTCGMAWHWFDHARALAEVTRLLVPGGHLFIAHYSYLPQHSELARESEALVVKHNPAWKLGGWNGLYPFYVDMVITDAMKLTEQFCYDHAREMTHQSWRGRMRTCNGVGSGGMNEETVEKFDQDLAELLATKYPEPLRIPHRIHCVVAQKVGASDKPEAGKP